MNIKDAFKSEGFKKVVRKSPIWIPMGVGLYTMGTGLNNLFNQTIGVRHHISEERKKQQLANQVATLNQMRDMMSSQQFRQGDV